MDTCQHCAARITPAPAYLRPRAWIHVSGYAHCNTGGSFRDTVATPATNRI